MSPLRIVSGDRFPLRTSDPKAMPLPSFILLDMAFKLSHIVSLWAAVGEIDPMLMSTMTTVEE